LKSTLRISLASIACAAFLAGCATNEQGQLVVDPNKMNEILAGALSPPPPPPPVVVEEGYEPMPNDIYVSNVVDRDVVFLGGDTYIWVVGPDGARHRRFYAHGDHREDVFHRRDELHRVIANHGGHLPAHAIAAHESFDHAGGPVHPGAIAQNHPTPGGPALAHAAVQNRPTPAAIQNRPAPAAKPAAKEVKKS
jgi:hypothetical protein